jgi:hypothetical protein
MDATDKVVALRPGMSGDLYLQSVPDLPKPFVDTTPHDTEGKWPPTSHYSGRYLGHGATIVIDHQGWIARVGLTVALLDRAGIPGLHAGMTLSELIAAYPNLSPEPEDKHGVQAYAGATTPEGYELVATARNGVLLAIGLERPGAAAHHAARAAFIAAKTNEAESARRAAEERRTRWRTIDDPAQMLRDWAATSDDWGKPPVRFVAYAEWLIRATPDERHAAALNWNWDYGIPPILYIVRQPDCDLATALEIFYLAQPSYYHVFDDDPGCTNFKDEDEYGLIKEIRDGVNAGRFTRRDIAFLGVEPYDRYLRGRAVYDPAAFRLNLQGKARLDLEFDDGVPPEALTPTA